MIIIYAYENKINGKIYIGQTSQASLEERADNGRGYEGCGIFIKAIKKYGFNQFDKWIIKYVDSQQEADQEEIFWIAEMREQLSTDNVYNLREGGSRGKHSDETKAKLKKAWETRPAPSEATKQKTSESLKGRVLSQETKIKKSIATKEYLKNNPPNALGLIRSEETKNKMSKSMTGLKKGKTWKLINGKRVWFDKPKL